MGDFNIFYDEGADILFFGKRGEEEEFVEIEPNIHVELDKEKNVIGVEIIQASRCLREALPKMVEKAKV